MIHLKGYSIRGFELFFFFKGIWEVLKNHHMGYDYSMHVVIMVSVHERREGRLRCMKENRCAEPLAMKWHRNGCWMLGVVELWQRVCCQSHSSFIS